MSYPFSHFYFGYGQERIALLLFYTTCCTSVEESGAGGDKEKVKTKSGWEEKKQTKTKGKGRGFAGIKKLQGVLWLGRGNTETII